MWTPLIASSSILLPLMSCSLVAAKEPAPESKEQFVAWVDSGFETGAYGVFDSMHDSRHSRLTALLQHTEYADFDYRHVSTAEDGRQLRFWSDKRDQVLVVGLGGTKFVERDGDPILDDAGRCVGTYQGLKTDFRSSRLRLVDNTGAYLVTQVGPGALDAYVLYRIDRPSAPLATITGRAAELIKTFDSTVYVCGRLIEEDPSGVWVERFRIEGSRIRQREYHEIACPAAFGAVFAFVADIDGNGRVLLGVNRRAPFVSPRVYYLVDPSLSAPQRLDVNWRGRVLFLDRSAVRQIADGLVCEEPAEH